MSKLCINVAPSKTSAVGQLLNQTLKVSGMESRKMQVYWIPVKYSHHIISVYYNSPIIQTLIIAFCRWTHWGSKKLQSKAHWDLSRNGFCSKVLAVSFLWAFHNACDETPQCAALGQQEAVVLSPRKLRKLCHTQTAFQQAVIQVPRGSVPLLPGKCTGALGYCSVADLAMLFGFPWNLRTSFKLSGYWPNFLPLVFFELWLR